jgi:hypothetical protein
MFWSIDVHLTMYSIIRIFALAIISNYILKNFNEKMFLFGIFLALCLQALPLILVIGERHTGLARYESILGAIGFLGMMIMPNKYLKIPFVLITGLTLGTSGARSAIFAGSIGFFSKIHHMMLLIDMKQPKVNRINVKEQKIYWVMILNV